MGKLNKTATSGPPEVAVGAGRKRSTRPGEGRQKPGANRATTKVNAYPADRDWMLLQSQEHNIPTAEVIHRLCRGNEEQGQADPKRKGNLL